jgi:hypothetical protein
MMIKRVAVLVAMAITVVPLVYSDGIFTKILS